MSEQIKKTWLALIMEAAGLAGFVIGAALLSIFLEHPDSPVMKSKWGGHEYELLRRVPLGIVLGAYITIVILVCGKRSGAHINPSVTWTFYRLGKISFKNAAWYTAAQFAGAILAAELLKITLGNWFSHPSVNYGNAEPKPPYNSLDAFIAEFIISFILMLVMLIASASRRYEKYVAIFAGVLIAIYLIIELPFSGMSLNPARSTGAALVSNEYNYLWIYFAAPTLAMFASAEIFLIWRKKQLSKDKNRNDVEKDYKEIPVYPVK